MQVGGVVDSVFGADLFCEGVFAKLGWGGEVRSVGLDEQPVFRSLADEFAHARGPGFQLPGIEREVGPELNEFGQGLDWSVVGMDLKSSRGAGVLPQALEERLMRFQAVDGSRQIPLGRQGELPAEGIELGCDIVALNPLVEPDLADDCDALVEVFVKEIPPVWAGAGHSPGMEANRRQESGIRVTQAEDPLPIGGRGPHDDGPLKLDPVVFAQNAGKGSRQTWIGQVDVCVVEAGRIHDWLRQDWAKRWMDSTMRLSPFRRLGERCWVMPTSPRKSASTATTSSGLAPL